MVEPGQTSLPFNVYLFVPLPARLCNDPAWLVWSRYFPFLGDYEYTSLRSQFVGLDFIYFIQHCVICRLSDSTVSKDAGIEPRTVACLHWEPNHSTVSHSRFRYHLPSGLTSSTTRLVLIDIQVFLIQSIKKKHMNPSSWAWSRKPNQPPTLSLSSQAAWARVKPDKASIPSVSLCSASNQAVQGSSRDKHLFLVYLSAPLQTRLCKGRAGPSLYFFYISLLHFKKTGESFYSFYISLLYFKPGCARVKPGIASIPSISLCSIPNLVVQGSSRSKPLFLLYLSAPLPARLCNGRAGPILYSFYISLLHSKPGCAIVEPGLGSIPSISLCSALNQAVQGSSRAKPLFLLYLSALLPARLCKGQAWPSLYSFYISLLHFHPCRLCNCRAGPNLYSLYISLLYFQLGYEIDELGHVSIPFNISLLPSTEWINPV